MVKGSFRIVLVSLELLKYGILVNDTSNENSYFSLPHDQGVKIKEMKLRPVLSGWGYYYISNALHDHDTVQQTAS